MFSAALFTMAKRWKQPNYASADEGISETCTSTMEYYLARKRSGMLTHATMWIKLESTLLSERNHSQKTTYGTVPLRVNV